MNSITITPGHIARHTPQNAGSQGREAAIIDIAQDVLLRHLYFEGVLEELVFKGGTALRKLYAGTAGRFSLDLDFSTNTIGDDTDNTLSNLIFAVNQLSLGPFTYGVAERRGKWILTYSHSFDINAPSLQSKLDLSPPPWLSPVRRSWIPLPIHEQYGDPPLPELQTIQLVESLAEKIARLNRATPARDMYDLRWIATNPSIVGCLDQPLIRRLVVLKIWVDANGLHAGNTFWRPGHRGFAFDPENWLRARSSDEFDTEDIGALTVPPPTAKELSESLRLYYRFLLDLDEEECIVAQAREQDRPLVLRLLSELPGERLKDVGLY